MNAPSAKSPGHPVWQAIWNMRLAALIICGPLIGLVLLDRFYGLPGKLWLLAGGFLLFSLFLFGILVRGEIHRLRHAAHGR